MHEIDTQEMSDASPILGHGKKVIRSFVDTIDLSEGRNWYAEDTFLVDMCN